MAYIPNIKGLDRRDVQFITSEVMTSLDEISRDWDFVDDYAREVASNRFDNDMFDALVEVVFDFVDQHDAWDRPEKYVDQAVMTFAALWADEDPDMERRYYAEEISEIDRLVAATQGTRGRSGYGARDRNTRGNTRGRQPIAEARSGGRRGTQGGRDMRRGRTQQPTHFRDSQYNGGRSMSDDPDDVSVRLTPNENHTRTRYNPNQRQAPKQATRRDMFEGRVEQSVTTPPASQSRPNGVSHMTQGKTPIYTNEGRKERLERERQTERRIVAGPGSERFREPKPQTQPQLQPTNVQTQGTPMTVEAFETHRGKVNLVHQFAEGAKYRTDKFLGHLVSPYKTHVFFEEGTDGYNGIYVIPDGEINVNKKLHRVERFFQDWKGNTEPDEKKTDATIKALQTKITISKLEQELAEKYNEEDVFNTEAEEHASSQLIVLDTEDIINGLNEVTAADARGVISAAIAEDGVLAKMDIEDLNFAYRTHRTSTWAVGEEFKDDFLSLRNAKNYKEVKEWLLRLDTIGLPKEVIRDLNVKLTKWINDIMHRVYGNHTHVIDSFVGDIEELETMLDQFNVDKDSWGKICKRCVEINMNMVVCDEVTTEKYGITAPKGSIVLMEPIDVFRIGMSGIETALEIPQGGRGLVTQATYPELVKCLMNITTLLEGQVYETVIITNDGERMYVNRTSPHTYYITRV